MNIEAIERGKRLIRSYYTSEAIKEMYHEFLEMHLADEEFPVYVAYCYDLENAPVDPHCW